MSSAAADPARVIQRLADAINAHDLEALVACFADDVVSEQPVHPARSFRGRAQVRANWTQIFGGVPDLRAQLLQLEATSSRAWSEWSWSGTTRAGTPFEMRGVTIQELRDDQIAAVRFYLEPLDAGTADVAATLRTVVGPA